MRVADLARQYISDNALTGYEKASMWQEDHFPFNMPESKIILTRQNGRAVDAFTRQIDVDVMLFSKANSEGAERDALFDDAEAALVYIKQNFIISDDLKLTITQDVTGPYQTGQSRFYYRFAFLTYSE